MSYLDETADLYSAALFGQHARRVSAFLYIQEGPDGSVSLVGGSARQFSQVGEQPHPLRYGSTRTHQLVVGEIIVRPTRLLVATDALRGQGLAGLVQDVPDAAGLTHDGRGEILMVRP